MKEKKRRKHRARPLLVASTGLAVALMSGCGSGLTTETGLPACPDSCGITISDMAADAHVSVDAGLTVGLSAYDGGTDGGND